MSHTASSYSGQGNMILHMVLFLVFDMYIQIRYMIQLYWCVMCVFAICSILKA